MPHRTTAIVGAGIAGLACARVLINAGIAVSLFDKARGPGGRLASRRGSEGIFDHGAQFFTARTEAFRSAVATWSQAGVVAPWTAPVVCIDPDGLRPAPEATRYCGVPRMSALTRHLATGLPLHTETTISSCRPSGEGWFLSDGGGAHHGPFPRLVLALPGPQAGRLLEPDDALGQALAARPYHACWALLLRFTTPLTPGWAAASVDHPVIGWVAHDSSKPERESGQRWVVHAAPAWSDRHVDDPPEAVVTPLLQAFKEIAGPIPDLASATSHRWRFARPTPGDPVPVTWQADRGLGLCGDVTVAEARVEAAWLSGLDLAQQILA